MEKIFISDKKRFHGLCSQIANGKADGLHILADFDKTITKAFFDGKEIPSLISILRDGKHLTADYAEKAHFLFNKYHSIEIDPSVSNIQKKEAMKTWWTKHYDLLIESRLNKKDIVAAVDSPKIVPREGFSDFLKILQEKNIPLLIISASGLGRESIEMFFKKHFGTADGIYVVSNEFVWDKKGFMMSAKEPIVHSLNKDESILSSFPFYNKIKNRKNIILLGDSLDDSSMSKGFNSRALIKIGFLNNNIEKSLPAYLQNYDVVVTKDGTFDYAINLLKLV